MDAQFAKQFLRPDSQLIVGQKEKGLARKDRKPAPQSGAVVSHHAHMLKPGDFSERRRVVQHSLAGRDHSDRRPVPVHRIAEDREKANVGTAAAQLGYPVEGRLRIGW